ncbi:hypothetical protein D0860_00793 [Hortaea werneckii]|uniref:Uncharacterized protein n=1 Tax=Hortaea werneckii TaxID=91943 RepID=A0A3M7HV13_HORWE|nr:hypothetical protein D0860_00793 [Hortaea werneckii]
MAEDYITDFDSLLVYSSSTCVKSYVLDLGLMPKKRTLKLKQFQGSSSASASNTGASAGQDGGDSPTSSVNERLSQLRVADSLDANQRKRELAELVAQKSTLPPELRRVLGVPESAAPAPKPGQSSSARGADRMQRWRTPGPAAPKSWLGLRAEREPTLSVRGGGGRRKKAVKPITERNRPQEVMRFAKLIGSKLEKPKGLTHLTLKRLAQHWELVDEEDYSAFGEIPLRLRLQLICYLGVYGPPIDAVAFKALTQGSDPIDTLDLAGLAGHGRLTIRKLAHALEPKAHQASQETQGEILDSWDAEETLEDAVNPSLDISRFAHLTHLSLSHPPPNVSWRELLSLSKHVPQLTHLSLAYWPRPTRTPHLSTATISSGSSPEVRAGGTHIYSGLDQDYSEAASLLRQLSNHLLCLQWLDLEGCAEWMPALALHSDASPLSQQSQRNDEEWGTRPSLITLFTDMWKNVNYINCSQGWLPASAEVTDMLTGYIDIDLRAGITKYLRAHGISTNPGTTDMYDVEKRRTGIWFEGEKKTRHAARRINTVRRAKACKPITFDFGWTQEAPRNRHHSLANSSPSTSHFSNALSRIPEPDEIVGSTEQDFMDAINDGDEEDFDPSDVDEMSEGDLARSLFLVVENQTQELHKRTMEREDAEQAAKRLRKKAGSWKRQARKWKGRAHLLVLLLLMVMLFHFGYGEVLQRGWEYVKAAWETAREKGGWN